MKEGCVEKNGEPVRERRRALVTVKWFDAKVNCVHVVVQPSCLVTSVVTMWARKQRSHLRKKCIILIALSKLKE